MSGMLAKRSAIRAKPIARRFSTRPQVGAMARSALSSFGRGTQKTATEKTRMTIECNIEKNIEHNNRTQQNEYCVQQFECD